MPAMLDDPTASTIYRNSGPSPFPDPHDVQSALSVGNPRQVTLRDRVTVATIIPFSSRHQVPATLLEYLSDQLNKEIEGGDTYPMIETMSAEQFSTYWFQNFGAIMLLGNIESADEVVEGKDWARECLGSFYIKPNYPGRSSHVCNAGFLVTDAARNKGVGRLMGESYLDWAPRLGYNYSVFNLVYETNVASCRIWDALGFKRIGRVKGAGNLKSYPGQLIDAIIYGRDLGPEGEDFVNEERFDKIKFYLKWGKYPAGADRAEKSRLRSAATHYHLIAESDKLMLKDKEVITDPQRQYEIARNIHVQQHGGINKTTAIIAEKYHWVRIKETVSLVIRNCTQCKELGKSPVVRADGVIRPPTMSRIHPPSSASAGQGQGGVSAAGRALSLAHQQATNEEGFPAQAGQGSVSPQVLNRTLPANPQGQATPHSHSHSHLQSQLQHQHHHQHQHQHQHQHTSAPIARMQNDYMPLDPQIMEDVRHGLGSYEQAGNAFHAQEQDSFQAMLGRGGGNRGDGDLDMMIDQDGEGEDESEEGAQEAVVVQLQAEAEEALRTVGREYGNGNGNGNGGVRLGGEGGGSG
ncbi:Protein SPT10 [Lachnellula cervina]|uniref:Protein SPT10 n=1 Tax=Lachnellula cervina TaxID=1316786 RepID=A0A7D8UT40_9HELO|nr:Protein SPT10 [Lachnellula cervina]